MAEPTVVTDRAAFHAAAHDAEPGARVPVEVRLAVADPFDAYRRARGGCGGTNAGDERAEADASGERVDADAGTETDAGAAAGDGAFLETTGGQDGWGYFGVDPIERLTVGPDAAVWRVGDDGECTPASTPDDGTEAGRAPTAADSPTLAALGGWLDGQRLARGDCDVPYPCGAAGWLSYDVARELESLPGDAEDDRELPRCQFAAFDRLAAWECPASEPVELRITACPRVGSTGAPDDCPDADAAYERGLDRALDLVERIQGGRPEVAASDGPASRAAARADDDGAGTQTDAAAGDDGAATGTGAADAATFESDCGRAAFAERVERIQDAIRAGETFQTNVSHRLTAPAAVHPVAAYDALREVNPAPYSALLELPAADLVSASPELLLERAPPSDRGTDSDSDADCDADFDSSVDRDSDADADCDRDPDPDRDHDLHPDHDPHRDLHPDPDHDPDRDLHPDPDRDRLRTEPIAGTRPRGATDAADRDLEGELRGDEKERAEHAMLVDLERNDLGKVCAYGSVDVTEYRRVDRYAEVMHLVSLVEGDLRADASLADAIAALFPGGTITGAPKPRTMQLIDEVEATRRGPYTGSVGLFGFDGRATLNIVIRTLVRCADEYHLRVGAGIVHDSEPEREYAETLDKARALVTAVDRALGEHADLAVEQGGERA